MLCLLLLREEADFSREVWPSLPGSFGNRLVLLKGMRGTDVIGHRYIPPQLHLLIFYNVLHQSSLSSTLCHAAPGLCLHLRSPKNTKNWWPVRSCTLILCSHPVKRNKRFLCPIKDLIANLLMTSDMCVILLLPSGHTVSLQLMWCEAGIHYPCTLLGNIYGMSAGGQDGLLTSSSSPPVPVGATHWSPGRGLRKGLER